MARKPRGQGRPPGAPAQPPQTPRPHGGGSWAPLRDAVRRDIEQAAGALAFAAALHERLEPQRRLFADFPRVMEQLRSGGLERVATALSRLFEGKDQFDLTRFLRDLPLALAQLAAAEAVRKAPPKETASQEVAHGVTAPAATAEQSDAPAPQVPGTGASDEQVAAEAAPAGEVANATAAAGGASEAATETETSISTEASTVTATSPATSNPASSPNPPSTPTPVPAAPSAGSNGGAPAEPPSPRLELRSRLLAAAPQLGKAVMTYRRTVATVRRAAAPRRAPGPWRSDREVLEEAKLAVEFARQLFDAYAEAWADQPTQPGNAEAMGAEMDRFLAWTQLARYMEVAAPRSQPPPAEKPAEKSTDKQPVTQGTAGAGATPADGEPAHGA